jgi:hypothetical protein
VADGGSHAYIKGDDGHRPQRRRRRPPSLCPPLSLMYVSLFLFNLISVISIEN